MKFMHFMLTAGGLGHLRPASGTWGSTPPPALALLLVAAFGANGLTTADHAAINIALVLLGTAFGIACVRGGAWAEERWGKKDPGQVVADEVAGQSLTLLALPWQAMTDAASIRYDIMLAAIAFLAFRAFDIVKPPPANGLERLKGGVGILIDDLFAGLYALIATQLIVRFLL